MAAQKDQNFEQNAELPTPYIQTQIHRRQNKKNDENKCKWKQSNTLRIHSQHMLMELVRCTKHKCKFMYTIVISIKFYIILHEVECADPQFG